MPKLNNVEEIKSKVIELYKQNLDTNKKIAQIVGITEGFLLRIVKEAGIYIIKHKAKYFTNEELEFIKQNYETNGVSFCAKTLNRTEQSISHKVSRLGLKFINKGLLMRKVDPIHDIEIINYYLDGKELAEIAKQFSTNPAVIWRILRDNGIKTRKRQLLIYYSTIVESIREDYCIKRIHPRKIAKKYKISLQSLQWIREEYKIPTQPIHQGENNPMYGKPSPSMSSIGISGKYKDIIFRSLKELSYMIYLDENNIKWESAENKFDIKYINTKGVKRTYKPDFLIGNKIIEIKPIRFQNDEIVQLKAKAAQDFCIANGLTYEFLDFLVDLPKIKQVFETGLIKFYKNCEERFMKICKKQNKVYW